MHPRPRSSPNRRHELWGVIAVALALTPAPSLARHTVNDWFARHGLALTPTYASDWAGEQRSGGLPRFIDQATDLLARTPDAASLAAQTESERGGLLGGGFLPVPGEEDVALFVAGILRGGAKSPSEGPALALGEIDAFVGFDSLIEPGPTLVRVADPLDDLYVDDAFAGVVDADADF